MDTTVGHCVDKTFTIKLYGLSALTLATYSITYSSGNPGAFTSLDGGIESSGEGTTTSAVTLTLTDPNISAHCAGKDLIVKVYNSAGEPIALTQDANGSYSSARVYFQPLTSEIQIAQLDGDTNTVSSYGYWAEQFQLVGNAPIEAVSLGNLFDRVQEIEAVPGESALDYYALDPNENSLQIAFDPSDLLAAGFADSKHVYRISIESADHQD